MNDIDPHPMARYAKVYETLIRDVTPHFVGRFLDNSTAALLDWAGEPSLLTAAKT